MVQQGLRSKTQAMAKIFQYILCYGSTRITRPKIKRISHFNTSYVMVQQLFKRSNLFSKTFQYILCYGSTKKYKSF